MKPTNQPDLGIGLKGDPFLGTSARALTLTEGKTSRRADALFKTLSTDYLLREQFVTDPAQILSEYVFGERLTERASDAANQLVYSVMSNPRLRDWMTEYARDLNGATPTRHAFALEFARAVAARGDEFVNLALIRGASEAHDDFVVQADVFRAIISVMGGRWESSGTEMSPGGGTEMSPGGGTEMSPGAERAFLRRESSGTEMSPGGGTEMSPGGGTEMSPGAFRAARLPGYLQVVLNALAHYAGQLRTRGALVFSGLESR